MTGCRAGAPQKAPVSLTSPSTRRPRSSPKGLAAGCGSRRLPGLSPQRARQMKAAVIRAQMSPRTPAAESSTSQGVAACVKDTEAASVQSSPGAAE